MESGVTRTPAAGVLILILLAVGGFMQRIMNIIFKIAPKELY